MANEDGMIIINRIFSGDFLSQGENLGHEIVNIFKASTDEEEKYYIYLMSDGNWFPVPPQAIPLLWIIHMSLLAIWATVHLLICWSIRAVN